MPKTVNPSVGIARDYIPVTPNDSTDNMTSSANDIVIGFFVGTGGAVVFNTDGGTRTITFPSGCFVPCTSVTRIKSTGTTATSLFSVVI